MSTLEERIARTSQRFRQRGKTRDLRSQMESAGLPSWRIAEDPARVVRRLADLGRSEEATSLMEGAMDSALENVGSSVQALERIIGTNDLVAGRFLYDGARTGRSVGRIVIRSPGGMVLGFGTGFKVSPDLIMTNNHVLGSGAAASNSLIQFDFYETRPGQVGQPIEFLIRPDLFFTTWEPLDFTITALEPVNQRGQSHQTRLPVRISASPAEVLTGEAVNIIQHPRGRPQELSLRENRVVDVLDDFYHYSSDTEQGSSGSPVFNDQWELVALHHSGVPRRDEQGRILLRDGTVWDRTSETAHLIAWVANEGVRVSRILQHLRENLESLAAGPRVLAEAFLESGATGSAASGAASPQASGPTITSDGRATWVVPVEVSIGLGDLPGSVVAKPRDATPPAPPIPRPDPHEPEDRVRRFEDEPYYEEEKDIQERDAYYSSIGAELSADQRFADLSQLVRNTHKTVLSYRSARLDHLYPWVDLRDTDPRELQSIYSGRGFTPQEVIAAELEIEAERAARRQEFLLREGDPSEEALEAFLEELEASLPFNCEHVVPQSWFAKAQPMRADLHHLFTCETRCNSFRSNTPYWEFDLDDEEAIRNDCGRSEGDKFEPDAGKGAVARATLYFLLRYPGVIGDEARELQQNRVAVLLGWHQRFPIDLWERHRNAEIAKIQGNRNPLIDHPEWADQIDFNHGFG